MNQLEAGIGLLWSSAGINIFAKRGPYILNFHAASTEQALTRIKMLGNWDVYACLNPARTTKGKPTIADITAVRWFMVDVDPLADTVLPNYGPVNEWLRNWLANELGIDHYAPTTVFTGRGFQLWVPVAHTTETMCAHAGIKGLIQQLATELPAEFGVKVDTTSGEISRVARLPGTINSKTGLMAEIVQHPREQHAECSLEALDKFAVMQYSVPAQQSLEGGTYEQIITALSPWSREFVLHGVASSVTSRHGRGYALLQELKNLGVARNFAHQMLISGCHRCKPPITDTDWMYRAASNVYGAA